MNKIVSGLLAATLSASFATAAALPANAEVFFPKAPSASSNVQTVEYRPWMNGRGRVGRNFVRGNDGMMWNGHRGYREYHRGYRRHGDYWFPLAAFATGALITGAIANDNRRVYEGDEHVQWCYNRYRSYRASDDTFQPNNGPRQRCVSPY